MPPVLALAIDPNNEAVIYAGTPFGLFKSTDGGLNWAVFNRTREIRVWALALDTINPTLLYIGTDFGVSKITVDGMSFDTFPTGAPGGRALALAMTGAGTLYLGTFADARLYVNIDGTADQSWFLDRTNVAPGASVFSNQIRILALDDNAWVSIFEGSYTINGTNTTFPTPASVGDVIDVGLFASPTLSTTVSGQLSIGESRGVFNVTTRATNSAPTLRLTDPLLAPILEGFAASVTFSAQDADGDAMTMSASGLPAGARFTDRGDGTATFTWVTKFGDAGVYKITFSVSDPIATNTYERVISVLAANEDPVLSLSLDEGMGTITRDESTNNLTGTLVRAVWQPGVMGNGLQLGGTAFVKLADHPALDLTGSFTLASWV